MTPAPEQLQSHSPVGLRYAIGRVVAAVVVALVTLTSVPASAHTDLVGSTPSDGARLGVAPSTISLEFNQAVDPSFATMVVSLDDGSPVRLDVTAGDSPSSVLATVPTTVSPTSEDTSWRVDYRVTSVDGHPIVGEIAFTVAAEAPAGEQSPLPQPEPEPHSTPPSATGDAEEERGPAWVPVVAASMFLVLAFPAILVLLRRRRDRDGVPRGEQQ